MTGIVVSYNADRGFGFIQPLIGRPDDTPNLFFHWSAIQGSATGRPQGIPRGTEVSFILVRAERGVQAANVTIQALKATALRRENVG